MSVGSFLYFYNTSEFNATPKFERFLCTCDHFTAASVLFKSVDRKVCDLDCSPFSTRDEERAAMVDGLCSSESPAPCFTVAETKQNFLPGRPIVGYCHMSTTILRHFCHCNIMKLIIQYRGKDYFILFKSAVSVSLCLSLLLFLSCSPCLSLCLLNFTVTLDGFLDGWDMHCSSTTANGFSKDHSVEQNYYHHYT